MLINLSNHPYSLWGERQKKAAAIFGTTVDLPFPSVTPDADEEEIRLLADIYMERVLDMGKTKDFTVHIMGEQTLCFTLISRLQQLGIPCIASCAARDVIMQPDGHKLVNFNFIRFRKYSF